MTSTEYIVMILKMVSLFFVLGAAYVVSIREDDDDDDDEGMYQLAYVTNEWWNPRLYRRSKCHTST